VIQQFFFFNFLNYVVNTLFFGTFFSYIFYIFINNSKQQSILKNDYSYNFVKCILVMVLFISFFLFTLFIFYFFKFFILSNSYSIFGIFLVSPNIHINFLFCCFEFSVDFFGIILLLLGYFIGVLSLLALDNRIF